MSQEDTQESTARDPSFTKAYDRSVASTVTEYIGEVIVILGVVVTLVLSSYLLDTGIRSIPQNLFWLVVFGVYPLIMGFVLRKKAKRNDVIFPSDHLVGMVCWTFLAWLGLFILLMSLDVVLKKATTNILSPVVLAGLFFGTVLFFGGLSLFIVGQKAALEAAVAPAPPERRDPADSVQSWFVQQVGGKKRKWRLSVYSDVIQLEELDRNELYEFTRSQAEKKIILSSMGSNAAWMHVWTSKHVMIRLNQFQQAVVKEWIGSFSVNRLKAELKQLNRFCIASVLLYVFAFVFPLPDLKPAIHGTWTPIRPELVVLWLLGVTFAVHYWPHRMIFLFQGGLIALLAVIFTIDKIVVPTLASIPWAFIVCVQMMVVVLSFIDYNRFADVRHEKDAEAEPPAYMKLAWVAAIAIIFYLWTGLTKDTPDVRAPQQASKNVSKRAEVTQSHRTNRRKTANQPNRWPRPDITASRSKEFKAFKQAFPHYGKPEFELAYQDLYPDWRKQMAPNGTWHQFLEVYKEFIDWWMARNSPRD
jgi:hypothetical protein